MEVVGIKRGESKTTHKPYTTLFVVTDFEDFETNYVGNKTQEIFIAKDVDVELGCEIDVVYGVGFGGKAIVKDIVVLEQESLK